MQKRNSNFLWGNTTIGTEMYVSDGTAAGTKLFKEFITGYLGGEPRNMRVIGNKMYLAAQGSKNNHELWVSDGTASGTKLVKEINSIGPSDPRDITPIGTKGKFLFTADEATYGRELYISDGTAAGTKLVKDIWPGGGFKDSSPDYLTHLNGKVYFIARPGKPAIWELFVTDGTAAGTKQLSSGTFEQFGRPRYLAAFQDKIWFAGSAKDKKSGIELWVHDPAKGTTSLFKDILPGSFGSAPDYLTPIGSRHMWFRATTAFGAELWATDGTSTGTVLVKDIHVGSSSSGPNGIVGERHRFGTTAGGNLYFVANDGANGGELYTVGNDGTSSYLGAGCGTATRVPTISATDPVLGKTMTMEGTDAYVGSTRFLVMGLPSLSGLTVSTGCTSWVDLTIPHVIFGISKMTTSTWSLGLPIPSSTSYAGVQVALQGWYLPTDAPAGWDLTNGLLLTVGK